MKLFVGLGNPGKRYAKTRHNVGFMALDNLRESLAPYEIDNWNLSKKFNAAVCGCTVKGEKVILAKPMTFMNESGQAVALIAHFYKISHTDITIIHDEKDLLLGDIRTQSGKNHAGHNGIKSIFEHVGTKDIRRIRVGIASENERKMEDTSKFVLGKFGFGEKKAVRNVLESVTHTILQELESI